MTAQQLVRLYPRSWRERYEDEFVATVGSKSLHPQQILDILGGAVDAWVSFKSRSAKARAGTAGNATTAAHGGEVMIQHWKSICATSSVRYTKRDALVSAGVLLVASLVLAAAGILARRRGHAELGDALMSLSFPVAVTISMPFAVLKGQPRSAQTVTIAFTLAILLVGTWIATKI